MWGATFIKLSVLSFDNRLGVQNITTRFIWAVRFAFALVIAYFITWNVLIFRQCAPFEAFWNQLLPSWTATHSYHCIDEGANALTNTIVSTISDFIAFMLPMILLWKLQMSMKQKVALSAVFAVGVLVCIVGVIRIYYYSMLYYGSYDVTWQGYRVFGTTDVELLLATICASAPALKVCRDCFMQNIHIHTDHVFSSDLLQRSLSQQQSRQTQPRDPQQQQSQDQIEGEDDGKFGWRFRGHTVAGSGSGKRWRHKSQAAGRE